MDNSNFEKEYDFLIREFEDGTVGLPVRLEADFLLALLHDAEEKIKLLEKEFINQSNKDETDRI